MVLGLGNAEGKSDEPGENGDRYPCHCIVADDRLRGGGNSLFMIQRRTHASIFTKLSLPFYLACPALFGWFIQIALKQSVQRRKLDAALGVRLSVLVDISTMVTYIGLTRLAELVH
jgi:hypothetical protein